MLTEKMRQLIKSTGYAFVASAGKSGTPHLAAGRDLRVRDDLHLVFEAWFCHTTMENLRENPRIAVAVTAQNDDRGYQFGGVVESSAETALIDGYIKETEGSDLPQVQYRLVIKVDTVLGFGSGIHSDRPL